MNLLKDLFHFTLFLFGAVIRMENLNYPNLVMLTNRIIIIIYIILWI